MILILGGAWQGKQAFALERFGLTENDVFTCGEDTREIPSENRVIAHIERLALGLTRDGTSPEAFWQERLDALRDRVLISDDISCGVVPIDTDIRAWREQNGRANNLLARHADEVWRVFCGLGQRLK